MEKQGGIIVCFEDSVINTEKCENEIKQPRAWILGGTK